MRRNLPATFRITGTRSTAETIRSCLENKYFPELAEIEIEGEKVPSPHPLPWYPHRLAWHISLSRMVIRHSPAVSKFHSFLVKENQQGNICRQEAVSMIPPLLMDIKSHHKVLDMCAAPGSKTTQLIELLHAEESQTNLIPAGVVVANDADNKRCYMLVHQAKRLNSPCLMVTNHDAAAFPTMYYNNEKGIRQPLLFDRVLCDVPCSGDGTLRKNPVIWREWTPSLAPSLHKLQLRILQRGLELLAPGGRIVYSTCSMNPVEDEAVIATALQLCKGAVELVDCEKELVGLKRLPGLTSWKVMVKTGEWLEKPSDIPRHMSATLTANMFPPDPSIGEGLHLERCVRVLPHHQDTGGFFISVLHKKDWLPWQNKMRRRLEKVVAAEGGGREEEEVVEQGKTDSENGAKQTGGVEDGDGLVEGGRPALMEGDEELEEGKVGEGKKRKRDADDQHLTWEIYVVCLCRWGYQKRRAYKEDPYVFVEKDSKLWQSVKEYYGLPDDFAGDQLLTRTVAERKKNVFLASWLIKELTVHNEQTVRVINIGVKVLARCENLKTACGFRLCQEGIQTMAPFITRHSIQITLDDILCLLREPNPLTSALSQQVQTAIGTMEAGPVIFRYIPDSTEKLKSDQEGTMISCPIYLSGWIAARSVRLLVGREDHFHYLAMLGCDPPENQSLAPVSGKAQDGDQGVEDWEHDEEGVTGDTDILQEQGKEEPVEMLNECSTEQLNGGI
eukprot:Em0018g185a